MTERAFSDRDRALLIDRWTTRIFQAETWADVSSLSERVIREVGPVRAIDAWTPAPIGVRWKPRKLSSEAKVELMAKATAAIKRAETWEAIARSLLKVGLAAAKAFGGAA